MNMDLRLMQLRGGFDGWVERKVKAGHTVSRECVKRICLTRFLEHDEGVDNAP